MLVPSRRRLRDLLRPHSLYACGEAGESNALFGRHRECPRQSPGNPPGYLSAMAQNRAALAGLATSFNSVYLTQDVGCQLAFNANRLLENLLYPRFKIAVPVTPHRHKVHVISICGRPG